MSSSLRAPLFGPHEHCATTKAARRRQYTVERVKRKLQKEPQKEITAAIKPLEDALKDIQLLQEYVEDRAQRYCYFKERHLQERQRLARENGVPLERVALPYNWEPCSPTFPVTPWHFNAVLVDEVIKAYLEGRSVLPADVEVPEGSETESIYAAVTPERASSVELEEPTASEGDSEEDSDF